MKEAVIITQSRSLAPGSYMPPIDFETRNSWNPFKQSRAEKIRKKLRKIMEEEQLDFQVNFDYTSGDLGELKFDEVAFYILTPLVSQYVELEILDENEYIVLTKREYNEADITRIVHKMKWLEVGK